jgi:sarcosine oxidase gamma subunit
MSLAAFEWVAFDGADAGTDLALGVAPARWLVVAPKESWLTERALAQQAGHGTLIDVSGRWVPVDIAQDSRALSAGAPLELILRDKDVASLWIFDCPVLVVRCNGETRVLAEASYAHSLRAMLARL